MLTNPLLATLIQGRINTYMVDIRMLFATVRMAMNIFFYMVIFIAV